MTYVIINELSRCTHATILMNLKKIFWRTLYSPSLSQPTFIYVYIYIQDLTIYNFLQSGPTTQPV